MLDPGLGVADRLLDVFASFGGLGEGVAEAGGDDERQFMMRIPVIVPKAAELARSRQIFMSAKSEGWAATAIEREDFMPLSSRPKPAVITSAGMPLSQTGA